MVILAKGNNIIIVRIPREWNNSINKNAESIQILKMPSLFMNKESMMIINWSWILEKDQVIFIVPASIIKLKYFSDKARSVNIGNKERNAHSEN